MRNGCDVTLVGSPRCAELAEAELKGETVSDADIAAEIAPCFVEAGGKRTDTIVLACTHYPLLLERMQKLAHWPVNFIDPAPAIARRIVDLLGPAVVRRSAHSRRRPSSPRAQSPPRRSPRRSAGFGLVEAAPASV